MDFKLMKGLNEPRVKAFVLKSNSTEWIRSPVRADVYSMPCRLFQIEEYAAPENAQECRTPESLENRVCKKRGNCKPVIQYTKDYAKDDPTQYNE